MKIGNDLAVFFLSFLFAGCASLRPEPFRLFERSIITASKGLETEMARDVEWLREADVDALAESKEAPLADHLLKDVKGYGWSTAVTPPHWEARLTLRALEKLDSAFQGYANFLTQAAQGFPSGTENQAALAAAMNQSLRDIEAIMGRVKGGTTLFPAGIAACSTESMGLAQRGGRAKQLRDEIRCNQSWVETYAALCRTVLDLVRANLKAAYADRMEGIHARWDDKRTPGRNTLARSIFNLNAEYADAMDSLEALGEFYARLPKAHGDLAEGISPNAKPRTSLSDLAVFAEQVARRTRELDKAR